MNAYPFILIKSKQIRLPDVEQTTADNSTQPAVAVYHQIT